MYLGGVIIQVIPRFQLRAEVPDFVEKFLAIAENCRQLPGANSAKGKKRALRQWMPLVATTRSPSSALLPFFEGTPTKTDYRRKGTLILTSLLADLDKLVLCFCSPPPSTDGTRRLKI